MAHKEIQRQNTIDEIKGHARVQMEIAWTGWHFNEHYRPGNGDQRPSFISLF